MQNIFRLLLTLLPFYLMGQSVPVICKNTPMIIYDEQPNKSQLFTVITDVVNGTVSLNPFPENTNMGVNGIGYRLQDEMIYGCSAGELIRIDGNGTAEVLADLPYDTPNGDVTPDGKYYVLLDYDSIYKINLVSGFYEWTSVPINPSYKPNGLFVLDIAFNPVTGVLYTFDTEIGKMVSVDISTGKVDIVGFQPSFINSVFPMLFFDSFANLWGMNGTEVLQLSTVTGEVLNKLPVAITAYGSSDGCSCPGSFNFQKTTWPDTVSHCGVMEFIFTVSNRSGAVQQNVTLEDWMPDGITIIDVEKNPFGGEVVSGPGTGHLFMQNLTIPEGVGSIRVKVRLDNLPSGIYKNQAQIRNIKLEPGQPEEMLSDNPATHVFPDSTAFVVTDLPEITDTKVFYLCNNDAITLEPAFPFMENYTWSTGETTRTISVDGPGTYAVMMESACEAAAETFSVVDVTNLLDVGDDLVINVGDSVLISPENNGTGNLVSIYWSQNPNGATIDCLTCFDATVFPKVNTTYTLSVVNEQGCTITDELNVKVEQFVYAANVFDPSAASPDNTFFLQSRNPLPVLHLQIFDRWGELVFERNNFTTNDIIQGWGGQTRGRNAPSGVYFWHAVLPDPNGNLIKMKGDITLLR